MGKRVSWNEPGHLHELTFVTYHRKPILLLPGCPELFLEALFAARASVPFDLYAYVLMPDHVHILLRPTKEGYEMAQVLSEIKLPAARLIVRHLAKTRPDVVKELYVERPDGKVVRQFWQRGGGYDRNMFEPTTVRNAIQYIHANPVRKGLCEATSDWPWSSAGAHEDFEENGLIDTYDPHG